MCTNQNIICLYYDLKQGTFISINIRVIIYTNVNILVKVCYQFVFIYHNSFIHPNHFGEMIGIAYTLMYKDTDINSGRKFYS